MSQIDWASLKQSADDATKPAPDGDYTLKCKKAEAKQASTGAQMIVCQFSIEGGPSHGKTIFHNLVLTPDNAFALSMFFRRLAAFGIDPATNNMSMEQIAAAMLGMTVDATIGHKEWQNTTRNEISEFRPNPMNARVAGASPMTPSSPVGSNQPPTPQVSSAPPTPSPTAAPVPAPGVPSAPPDEPF